MTDTTRNSRSVDMVRSDFAVDTVRWDRVTLIRLAEDRKKGVCGADANTIAARHFVRYVAAGTAAHSDHGRSVAELLIATARGEAKGYRITDVNKLHEVAKVI